MLYGQMLDEIAELGATDLQLVPRWVQADATASHIGADPERTVPDALLGWVLDGARARALRTFVMPIIHLRHRRPGEWRGTLYPTNLDAWWTDYRRFVAHYADLATRHRAELFAVGSELVSREGDVARWRALIADTRRRFRGELTYSANWDHVEPIAFRDALDVVGVTGYVPLAADDDVDEDRLVAAWEGWRQPLRALAVREGKSFMLTEIGYPARADAARRPWDYGRRGPPRPDVQTLCYRALFRAWHADSHLAGLYIWNWFGVGGPQDRGDTDAADVGDRTGACNRPALRVLDAARRARDALPGPRTGADASPGALGSTFQSHPRRCFDTHGRISHGGDVRQRSCALFGGHTRRRGANRVIRLCVHRRRRCRLTIVSAHGTRRAQS